MVQLEIRGAEQFGQLAKRLRAAGVEGKALRRELYRGLNRATKAPKADAKAAALAQLPHSGGLNRRVAESSLRTRTRAGANPSVRIVAAGRQVRSVRSIDAGVVRHPVFGTGRWVTQSVQPGWFTNAMQNSAPAVRREVMAVLESVVQQIARG